MKRLIVCLLLMFAAIGVVWAADNPAQDTQQNAEPGSTDVTGNADNELILDETDSEPQAEEEESPDRFIPTEEISQDLGVSFPVDI